MTSRDFVYWLQGFFEIYEELPSLTPMQVACIRKHLALVFKHEIDPSYGGPQHQEELNKIHGGDLTKRPPSGTGQAPNAGITYRC